MSERERECVCLCVRVSERASVCVRERERERESEPQCVSERERERERECVCVWYRSTGHHIISCPPSTSLQLSSSCQTGQSTNLTPLPDSACPRAYKLIKLHYPRLLLHYTTLFLTCPAHSLQASIPLSHTGPEIKRKRMHFKQLRADCLAGARPIIAAVRSPSVLKGIT